MSVTIRQVATKAGVSPMTVSRVINNNPRVRLETRQRVESAIAELGYVPNRLARGLLHRKTQTLGLIVTDVANPFFTVIVRGAQEVAIRDDYHVLLGNTQGDLERERGYIEDMLAFRVEGVVIAPAGDASRDNLNLLRRNGVPFVLIDRSIPNLSADLVQGDSIGGARQLVEHLIALGHRSIAMITESPDVSTARERLAGYREALEAAGISYRPELVVLSSAIDTDAHAISKQLLEQDEQPSAIFAVNNITALAVVDAVRDAGLRVPEDIAVVCFDDVDYISRLYPFLTVMAQPAETFGTIAMQLLLDRVAGRGEERYRTIVLPGELIVRISCGSGRSAPTTLA